MTSNGHRRWWDAEGNRPTRAQREPRPAVRLALVAVLLLAGGFLGGCASAEKPADHASILPRFHLESATNDGTPVTLPQSGVGLLASVKPVLTEGDVVNVELVQVELGRCLLFQLTPAAARDFYRMSVASQGRRLILFLNGRALGARRIEGPIADGAIFVFVEVPEADLPALVDALKKTTAALQKEILRKGK